MKFNLFIGLIVIFISLASIAFATPPAVGTIIPSSGTSNPNETVSFTTTYTDPDGWTNIQYVYLLVNTSTSGAYCFYGYYNQNTNRLYLRNDAGNSWLGGYSPGASNIIENTYVKLNCASTTISGSGTTITVTWSITFKSAFTGAKNTYLYVKDDTNLYNGWTKKGTWTIVNQTPSVGTITPSSGTSNPNEAVSFTTTYNDPDSRENIQYVYLLINTSVNGSNCFYGYYHRNSNKLYLRNDANTKWLGGYVPGTSNIIENSYVKLNCSTTTISGSSTTLTVNWSIIFKSPFTGAKNTYLYVRDNANAYSGFTKKGTWTITNQPPQVGTISPQQGSSTPDTPVTFATTYTDPDGWLNIQYIHLLINTSTSGAYCFYGDYDQNTNNLYLRKGGYSINIPLAD